MAIDQSGVGADWHLDYIAVTNTKNGAHARFLCKNWLDGKSGRTRLLVAEGSEASRLRNPPIIVFYSHAFKLDVLDANEGHG